MLTFNPNPEAKPICAARTIQGATAASTDESGHSATSAATAAFSADLQGQITAGSPILTQLLGYSPQELLGRSFLALFRASENAGREDQSRLLRTVLAEASAQGLYRCELFACPKSGEIFPVQLSAAMLGDASGTNVAVVAFVLPIARTTPAVSSVTTVAPGIISRRIDDTEFILASPVMHKFMGLVDRVAGHTETVLITGETGTGKELIARTIHESSHRRSRPWVDINCAALPENLVESELFGYEKGAFTGASKQTRGKIEVADGGTFFLDEVGDLPLPLQAKLLRFLQERVVERLGGREEIAVDVRIVCATHQNLKKLIEDGRFREDLYYRLSEIVIAIPPLRERPGDAVLIAHALMQKFCAQEGRSLLGFEQDALDAIETHPWPGNVREMENYVKRAVIMAEGTKISVDDLGLKSVVGEPEPVNLRQVRDEAERKAIIKVLSRVDGNIVSAAALLGVSRPTLYDLINRHGLKQSVSAKAEES